MAQPHSTTLQHRTSTEQGKQESSGLARSHNWAGHFGEVETLVQKYLLQLKMLPDRAIKSFFPACFGQAERPGVGWVGQGFLGKFGTQITASSL